MQRLSREVLALFGRQYGVASADQLRQCGLTHNQVADLVFDGQVLRTHQAVYRLVGFPTGTEQRALACVLADAEAVISHQTAGRLWGLRQMASPFDHVTVNHARHPFASATVKVHRSGVIEDVHVIERFDGIRITTVARTLFDLAGSVSLPRLESATEQAIRDGLVTVPDLWAVARQLKSKGRKGSGRFVAMLHDRPSSLRPVDSNLELLFERAIRQAGLPRPERQYPIRLRHGVTIHPDFAWPSSRVAVEIDHITWHGGVVPIIEDRARDRHLRLLGWQIERVSDREVATRLNKVVFELGLLIRSRRDKPPPAA